MSTSTYIVIIVILLICSAYFSATETAFSSLNKTKLKAIAEKGDKKAKRAIELSDKYDKLISTILIGNNIVNIAASSLGTVMFINILGGEAGPTVSTVVITVAVVDFRRNIAEKYSQGLPRKVCDIFHTDNKRADMDIDAA